MKIVKRLKWEKKLTAKEVRHVRELCGGSLRSFTEQADRLANMRRELAYTSEPCWECRTIAIKLGLEV
jgi:hypothetical protein